MQRDYYGTSWLDQAPVAGPRGQLMVETQVLIYCISHIHTAESVVDVGVLLNTISTWRLCRQHVTHTPTHTHTHTHKSTTHRCTHISVTHRTIREST